MKKNRKIIALLIALTFVFSLAVPAMAAASQYDSAAKLQALGIIEGYEDGSLGEDNTITRAEFAAIAVRALGLEQASRSAMGSTMFPDVKADAWYTGYINLAVNYEIIEGYPDGTFGPSNDVTYAEALAMIVRVLGYEEATRGTWPTNYLAKAAELGITNGQSFTHNQPAPRGAVFSFVDEALDVNLMEQTGFGSERRFEIVNKTLLTHKLDLTKVEERVTAIARTNDSLDDNEIRLGTGENAETYELIIDADVEYLYGVEVIAYANDDNEIVSIQVSNDSKVYIDAVEIDANENELTFVTLDKTIDYTTDTSADYEYAKVVLDKAGDVAFIDAYDWTGYLVVEEVDEFVVYSYGEELDAEDFTIVKGGYTFDVADLNAGDILFYNEDEDFAEVYNKAFAGKIDYIFDGSFEVDGKEFDVDGYYLDGDKLKALTESVLEDMQEEGAVEVFVDRAENVVFVVGELGDGVTSDFIAYVTENTSDFNLRGTPMWTLDLLTENGQEVPYDINLEDIEVIVYENDEYVTLTHDTGAGFKGEDSSEAEVTFTWAAGTVQKDTVVQVEVDSDGDIESIKFLNDISVGQFDVDDRFVGQYRLTGNAVAFLTEDYDGDIDDIIVTTFGALDFDTVEAADIYVNDKDEVIALVISDSSREDDKTDFAGVLTEKRDVTANDSWRLTFFVDGKKVTYFTKDDSDLSGDVDALDLGAVVEFKVDLNTNRVTDVVEVDADTDDNMVEVTIDQISVRDRSITVGTTVYLLDSGAVVYDAQDATDIETMNFRNLGQGDEVTLYLAADNSRYVSFVLLTDANE
ncbi:hypothetical protein GGQ84_000873 [Desulfitispora alkaliphila]|uniref:S-layer homology domain-containing protein n=1 Tax=Desulfitispora alkaliphila TaxID=622674 RepID=UPI003D22B425